MGEDLIKKYSNIYASPYLVGVFMGINAINDIALYVDGPDCNFFRVDMIYKTHDLFSTIKKPSINTRLYFSGVMPNKMIIGYEDKIKKKLEFIDKNKNFKVGIITSMPVTSLLGIQYNNIFDGFSKKFIVIPTYTDKFRIDGYEIFLRHIAKNIDLDENKKKEEKTISLIGFLFDRNEGDCLGNIEEIKRLLSLIGVEIKSIWLNGGSYDNLKLVNESSLLVTLPYGKYASKILTKRLKIDSLDLEVPFGLRNTLDFINKIGKKLQIDDNIIEKVIKKELSILKGKIDLLDSKVFLNKNYIYAGDPYLEQGLNDISILLGMNHVRTYKYIGDKIIDGYIDENIDFIIGNSEYNIKDKLKIEFGFPSYNTHYLNNRAFMGFEGLLNFIEKLYYELLRESKLK